MRLEITFLIKGRELPLHLVFYIASRIELRWVMRQINCAYKGGARIVDGSFEALG